LQVRSGPRLDPAGGVARDERIDLGNRQSIEIAWNRLLERARRDGKPQRCLEPATMGGPKSRATCSAASR
jgi:hypothetical protein